VLGGKHGKGEDVGVLETSEDNGTASADVGGMERLSVG